MKKDILIITKITETGVTNVRIKVRALKNHSVKGKFCFKLKDNTEKLPLINKHSDGRDEQA